jgi:simple sugar transport system ATP-binding protein
MWPNLKGYFRNNAQMAIDPETNLRREPALIQLVNISKRYGAIQSLTGVNLSLSPGEVIGLVGDNGAGKSTLSKVISGAVIPDEGKIFMQGDQVHFTSPADARARRIEMVYQDLSLCNTIDVAGNLFLGREQRKHFFAIPYLDESRMHQDAATMLGDLGIRIPNTRLKVEHLSGGQRQSIAIGRAAAFDPLVLIMDEPTAALAVSEVDAVLSLIKRVSARGVGVILITHRLQDLFVVCDRIVVMYEGRTVAERQIAETNIEEIVNLIVGRSYKAISTGARRSPDDTSNPEP